MRGRVPDKDAAFVPEVADLLVEEPVIGGEPRQKGERARAFFSLVYPVMDRAAARFKDLFRHVVSPAVVE